MQELPVIQKSYDFIRWYVPILSKLPKNHRFAIGDRMTQLLYELLEGLIQARYIRKNKLYRLEVINTNLDILRYQTRLLLDFDLISVKRYDYAGKQLRAIGQDLGAWIRQQQQASPEVAARN